MRCEDALLDVAPLLSGTLEADEERALLDHLSVCSACKAEAGRLREMWLRLGDLPVEAPDTQRLRASVSAAVAAFEAGRARATATSDDSGHRSAALSSRAHSAWAWVTSVAAALVMGVLLGRETVGRPSAPSSELTVLQQELRETREMVTLALLRQPSASERLKGVSWTGRIEDPGADVMTALLDALTHDPNVNVRLAAVDALVRYADRPAVRSRAVAALTGAPSDPLVQVALIDLLVQLREPASKGALQQLTKDAAVDPAVRDRATRALQQLGEL